MFLTWQALLENVLSAFWGLKKLFTSVRIIWKTKSKDLISYNVYENSCKIICKLLKIGWRMEIPKYTQNMRIIVLWNSEPLLDQISSHINITHSICVCGQVQLSSVYSKLCENNKDNKNLFVWSSLVFDELVIFNKSDR